MSPKRLLMRLVSSMVALSRVAMLPSWVCIYLLRLGKKKLVDQILSDHLCSYCVAKQPNIDGFLVGGASINEDFLKIIAARQ